MKSSDDLDPLAGPDQGPALLTGAGIRPLSVAICAIVEPIGELEVVEAEVGRVEDPQPVAGRR